MSTLHITNGAALAGSLRETGLANDMAYWREALYQGPLQVTDDLSFAKLRSQYWELPADWLLHTSHLTETYPTLTALLPKLRTYSAITLWFEFDLYDQSILWYILRQLENECEQLPPISLISPDEFPGEPDFRGMGQLQPAQLKELLGTEKLLTPADFASCREAWEAYASGNPEKEVHFLSSPTSLPYAKRALQAHLNQRPQPPYNLGEIQLQLLQCIGKLENPLVYRVVGETMATYDRDYGLSDRAALEWLQALAADPRHLIQFTDQAGAPKKWVVEDIRTTHLALTAAGKALLS